MSELFTDKEMDDLDKKFKTVLEDPWDACNHQINLLQAKLDVKDKEIKRLTARIARIRDWYDGNELADGELEKLLALKEQSDE